MPLLPPTQPQRLHLVNAQHIFARFARYLIAARGAWIAGAWLFGARAQLLHAPATKTRANTYSFRQAILRNPNNLRIRAPVDSPASNDQPYTLSHKNQLGPYHTMPPVAAQQRAHVLRGFDANEKTAAQRRAA